MIELKRTTKWDGKIKGLHFEGNELIDENGEIVILNEWMKAAYADKTFDLSVTAKEEEILECEIEENSDEE
jgi:hypothetical protein